MQNATQVRAGAQAAGWADGEGSGLSRLWGAAAALVGQNLAAARRGPEVAQGAAAAEEAAAALIDVEAVVHDDEQALISLAWNLVAMERCCPTMLQIGGMDQSRSGRRSGGMGNMAGGIEPDPYNSLPKKIGYLLLLVVASRVGVYIRLPGVDVNAFSESMQAGGGLLGYIDQLSGGSISKVGIFSLGIVPYINASIILQLAAQIWPDLKKMQREDGSAGQARFKLYQRLAALAFAVAQAVGQLTYIKPYVTDFSLQWLVVNSVTLTAGSMILIYLADWITELKLGNGTSVLIFTNIVSALPTSIGGAIQQASRENNSNLVVYIAAFFLTTLGIVYVQEAERRIPMNYAKRSRSNLNTQSYLPFKVNATGVMPVIFASSLLAAPQALVRFINTAPMIDFARAVAPSGPLYLPANVGLICFFNWYYTFLQLEPKELSEQLKRTGASIPAVRPGRKTAEYITQTLTNMSVLGSVFLGVLAAAPAAVEALTKLTAFRGFAGTSVLIIVGVATDTARKVRAEQAMQKYGDLDRLYEDKDSF
eukprot:CAMPEP_0206138650 /NCGR_PEP_ID=MMETSP1473-20131121/3469_1 /ASSEMBLY_ACC=CAM_ASM_001109 /TAXON_ID=1461547 /ORGANISM="Stichococcus sp, Strain RCC1054" /LENGTH=536 /DNA_ID=CAMNT_0053532139 /DNA_START=146 /DNA_END=1757 /DNA_ORIENTATION=-